MVRTRIAPSPTGEDLHIGNLYTALINFVWAKKNKGKFIVRIEDTDRQRLVKGAEERILQTLKDFGLSPDEDPQKGGPYGPYRQSERLEIYQKLAHQLVEKGYAYYCTCSKERLDDLRKKQIAEKKIPRYDGHCRNLKSQSSKLKTKNYVIRLKVPRDRKIVVEDLLRGRVVFDSNNLDDQILLKSDGYPTYHLAVVIDDCLMKISHIIRAEEWLSSTPKHILLYEAFGWEKPVFCHLPILRNPDRSKLSKRKNPVWASWYLKQGYLPWAVLNYLALMGWSHPQEKEIFSLEEFIEVFDLKDLQVVGPAFDPVKLEWMNGEYIRKTQNSKLKTQILDFYKKYQQKNLPENLVEKTVPLIQERIKKLSDYWDYCQFFFERPKEYQIDLSNKKELLKKIYQELETISDWKAQTIGEKMVYLAKKLNIKAGEFFMILRVAITGKKITPPLNESMEILGKEECVKRLKFI
ncbi:MAG: glutamate--tRNA ligase [Patescibacteria group bacterium]|nr:glutamate--tRNA ligase [Patescibacteria group bacterium]